MSLELGAGGAGGDVTLIALGSLVLTVAAAVAWWSTRRGSSDTPAPAAAPAPPPVPEPVVRAPATAAAPARAAEPAPAPVMEARASAHFPNQSLLDDVDPPTRMDTMPTRADPVHPKSDSGTRAAESPDAPNRLGPGGPPTVLVVEDNPVNAMVAKRLLEQLGCVVHHAENGQVGVAAVNARRYDLVFMDCDMPVMDGYDATRAIRAMDRGAVIPILALTAHSMEENRVRCIDAGMNDFLVKPVRRDVLQAALTRWLDLSGYSGRDQVTV
jgi:CheY-like chemotaxis protein